MAFLRRVTDFDDARGRIEPARRSLLASPGPKGSTQDAFSSRDDILKSKFKQIEQVFDAYTSPPIFGARVCGLSPALLLWLVNALCFVVHTGMAVTVLIQGRKGGELLDIPTKTLVGVWRNRTSDGYESMIRDAALTLRLDTLCFLFALTSATAHFLICCFSLYAVNEWHARFNLRYYYYNLYDCLTWWRWLEYSISAPIMAVAIMLTAGIREVNVLALGFFLQSCTMLFGWCTELLSRPGHGKGQAWEGAPLYRRLVPYFFGWYSYVPAWVVFVAQFFRNVKESEPYNDRDMPEFVYTIVLSEVIVFTLFAIPLPLYQALDPKMYYATEIWYSFLSLTSKTLLNGLLLANVFVFS